MKVKDKIKYLWFVIIFLVAGLFLINISLGSVSVPIKEIVKILAGYRPLHDTWREIILNFRLTKAVTCVLVGAALSLSGLQMQTLFRNPLAGPDVFGLSSGASLAVSFVFLASNAGVSLLSYLWPWSVVAAASLGSLSVAVVVLVISSRVRDNAALLIIGLMIGAATSSIVSVLQYLSRAEEQQAYLMWTFGNVGSLNWHEISVLCFMLLVAGVISILSVRSMNAWLLGDYYAQSLGVDIYRSRVLVIISTSILAGGVTAFCGPIAFVGLAVPHLTKILVKTTDHKILVPVVVANGAGLMLFCDILRCGSMALPINAITSLIGAPVVIWVVVRGRRVAV